MSQSKRHIDNLNKIDRDKEYGLDEAASILLESSSVKFDESIEVAINLGVDPKHADQIVRGTVSLPHGTGKDVKVLVFVKGDMVEEVGIDTVRGRVSDINCITRPLYYILRNIRCYAY